MDFKERFGLDYLAPQSQSSVPPTLDPVLPKGLGQAIIAHSGKILNVLNDAANKTMALFDIAKAVSMRVETLSTITQVLINEGLIEIVQSDSVGNDIFRLTDTGVKTATSLVFK